MKIVGSHLILSTAALVLVLLPAARAEDTKEVAAKLAYCEVCHGVSAQGFHGNAPIPRLAGQQTEYLENQLKAFIERRRLNSFMFNVAHVLSPAMQTALAQHFAGLNPKPVGGAPRELVAAGK